MDGMSAVLEAVASRGWLIIGLAALTRGFVAGVAPTTLAIALGSIILGARALRLSACGLAQLASAVIAWRQVAPLFTAAARPVAEGAPIAQSMAASAGAAREGVPLLEAHDLTFRHEGREEPVLRACTLRINRDDRILLEGPSGAGKSTFGAILVGLRDPQTGMLLLNGLDRPSLGARAWRRRVVAAPQFHENHVLAGTFLFNVLMGTDAWPPRRRDLEEVEAVCRELGLGDLLARMPGGLFQMVGETGWQLSHGERSRLYVARALLQHADLVVLDESFAALDPENLARALRCVLARARTLVVIAHP
jgi:ATP-binding cassette subfamily B protein